MATDTFTNTDETPLTTHSASWVKSGVPTASSTQTGVIRDGRAYMSTGAASEWIVYYHSSTPPSATYTVSATVGAADSGFGTGIAIRVTPSSAHDSTSKGYVLAFRLANGGAEFGLLKKTSGTAAETLAGMATGPLSNVPYKYVMEAAGGSTTTITCKVQRISDSWWLTPAGGWQVGEVACLVGVDSTSPFTAAGHGGISLYGPGESTNDANYIDNFNVDSVGGGSSVAGAYYRSIL